MILITVICICYLKINIVKAQNGNETTTLPLYKIEPLPNSHASLGEGPHWDMATQSLYYVDVLAGRLMRYDYQEQAVYACKIKGENLASFIIPIEGKIDKFAVGCERRVVIVNWDGKSESCDVDSTLFEVQTEPKFKHNRFNEGKCDPHGRLFAGTFKYTGDVLSYRYGELYKYEKGGKVELVLTNLGISNGLAWNEPRRKFYFIDTPEYEVKEYDYDFENGVAMNPKVVYDSRETSPKDQLLPDGMTIDTEGNIYVALVNGGKIVKVDPRTGQVLLEINFPINQISSAAWGGPKLDILYVATSAMFNASAPAGALFQVTGLGAKGLRSSKMQLPHYKIEPLPNSHVTLGEGPHWDMVTQSLYYTDALAGRLMRYDYREKAVYACKIKDENLASFIIPIKGETDKFAVGCERRVVIINWDGKSESCDIERTLFEVQTEPKFKDNRFNEGKCDPRGRLFAGTFKYTGDVLSYRYGELYKYEKGGKVELVLTNLGISNGLAFNEARRKFYFIDTPGYEVKEYDYDLKKGVAVNPKVVYDSRETCPKGQLLPDGMTIDAKGNIYVAIANGGRIVKVNPRTGRVLLEINFPVNQISSAAWGGPKLDILYVGTGAMFNASAPAGALFQITGLGAKGLRSPKMQL